MCDNCGESRSVELVITPSPIGRGRRRIVPVSTEPYRLCVGCYIDPPNPNPKVDRAKTSKAKPRAAQQPDDSDPLLR